MQRSIPSTFAPAVILAVALSLVPLNSAAQTDADGADSAASSDDQAAASDASAEENGSAAQTISTDRPGFSSSTDTAPSSQFQLEAGVSYSRTVFSTTAGNNRPDSASINTFGVDALGRYGINDSLELRLGILPIGIASATNQDATDVEAIDSISVGAKYTLFRGDTVSAGVLPALNLTSVTDSTALNAGLTGILDIHLLDPVSTTINGTIGGGSLATAGTRNPFLTYSAAASFGYSFSSKVGAYAEYYLLGAEGTDPDHHIDGGLTYLLSNRLQLDLYGDYEISGDNTFQLGAGVSYLFGG